jgi:2-hydroxychromene-2-carboxylate isomerase
MARTLEFYYDYGSPYSYLADTQVEAIAKRAGASLVRKPMLLGGVFKATGNASPMTVPLKSKWAASRRRPRSTASSRAIMRRSSRRCGSTVAI